MGQTDAGANVQLAYPPCMSTRSAVRDFPARGAVFRSASVMHVLLRLLVLAWISVCGSLPNFSLNELIIHPVFRFRTTSKN